MAPPEPVEELALDELELEELDEFEFEEPVEVEPDALSSGPVSAPQATRVSNTPHNAILFMLFSQNDWC